MELVQIRIRKTIDTSRYGAMSDGDLLRTDAAYARHLVEDLAAAKYVNAPARVEPQKPARKRKHRASE